MLIVVVCCHRAFVLIVVCVGVCSGVDVFFVRVCLSSFVDCSLFVVVDVRCCLLLFVVVVIWCCVLSITVVVIVVCHCCMSFVVCCLLFGMRCCRLV